MDQAKYAGYKAEIAQLERMLQAFSGNESDDTLIERIGLKQRLKQARAKIAWIDVPPRGPGNNPAQPPPGEDLGRIIKEIQD